MKQKSTAHDGYSQGTPGILNSVDRARPSFDSSDHFEFTLLLRLLWGAW